MDPNNIKQGAHHQTSQPGGMSSIAYGRGFMPTAPGGAVAPGGVPQYGHLFGQPPLAGFGGAHQ